MFFVLSQSSCKIARFAKHNSMFALLVDDMFSHFFLSKLQFTFIVWTYGLMVRFHMQNKFFFIEFLIAILARVFYFFHHVFYNSPNWLVFAQLASIFNTTWTPLLLILLTHFFKTLLAANFVA